MVKRGEIIYLKEEAYSKMKGNIESGTRPMLIVSNDTGNKHSTICVAVPLTMNRKKLDFPTHTIVNGNSVALCEQLFTISQADIERKIGEATAAEMDVVNVCLIKSLGLKI